MPNNLFNYDNPHADVFDKDESILADLSDADWNDLIGRMVRRSFPAGTKLLSAGDPDRTLYFLSSGSVDIVLNSPEGPRRLASIGEGSVFGEMAFFDGRPRSADVFARSRVEVLGIDPQRFAQLAAWKPHIAFRLLMDLGRVLSQRLRRLNYSH